MGKSDITSNITELSKISDNISVESLNKIFNHGAKAYKRAQELFLKIDDRIHNEFAYAARAYASLVENRNDRLALNDAFQAARHILNDSLDLIVGYAAHQTNYANSIAKKSSVKDVYGDYNDIILILKKFHKIIAETRSVRGVFRVNEYIAMVESDEYSRLCDYCESLPNIIDELKKKRAAEVSETRKWFAVVFIATVSASAGVITAVLKYLER